MTALPISAAHSVSMPTTPTIMSLEAAILALTHLVNALAADLDTSCSINFVSPAELESKNAQLPMMSPKIQPLLNLSMISPHLLQSSEKEVRSLPRSPLMLNILVYVLPHALGALQVIPVPWSNLAHSALKSKTAKRLPRKIKPSLAFLARLVTT